VFVTFNHLLLNFQSSLLVRPLFGISNSFSYVVLLMVIEEIGAENEIA